LVSIRATFRPSLATFLCDFSSDFCLSFYPDTRLYLEFEGDVRIFDILINIMFTVYFLLGFIPYQLF